MSNKNTTGSENYAGILHHASQLINYSFDEIKSKYADYPHCVIDYFEKNLSEKSIEILLIKKR